MRRVHLVAGIFCILQSFDLALANGSEYPALLGNGYDSLKLEHKNTQCIDGNVIEIVNRGVDFKISKVETWEQLQAQMNFSIPGSILVNSESELAKFTAYARDTRFTSSFILQSLVTVSEKRLTNPKFLSTEKDPARFRDECGTQYITSIKTGATLHVAIRFMFSDFESKIAFDAGGATKIAEIGARVDALSKTAKKNSSVNIFAHQVGGDLLEVNKLFDSKNVVSCSLEKFERCESLLEEIWNYSKDHFAKAALDGKSQTISFHADEYPNTPKVYENPVVLRERQKLLKALDHMDYDRDLLFSLKGEALKDYPDCDDRCLTRLISTVMSNSRVLRDSILLSFENPELFKQEGTLDKLGLVEVQMPVKRTDYYGMFMGNLHFIIPTGFIATVVPILIKTYWFAGEVSNAVAVTRKFTKARGRSSSF